MAGRWITLAFATLFAPVLYGQSTRETPVLELPFVAVGHEPGWRLEITETGSTLVTDYGSTTLRMAAREPEPVPGGRRYAGNAGGRALVAKVLDRVCEDEATGMPRPQTVELTLDEEVLQGCGGDPATLLIGPDWNVDDIAGAGLVDRARVTIVFAERGRLSGLASCNAFSGSYTITGEGLAFGSLAATATEKACAPAVMQQERMLLAVLAAVTRFEIEPDGTLVLHAPDRRTVRARR